MLDFPDFMNRKYKSPPVKFVNQWLISMKRSYKAFYLGIILISFLLTSMGSCGIFELFGERDSNPTKPCIELIPTPTPTPTPLPLILITPTPSSSGPSDSSQTTDCSDGPGTAVICNGEVISDIIILTPLPPPETVETISYTITSFLSYSYPCSGGSISPYGSVLLAEGANQDFDISIDSFGSCYGFEVLVDEASVYSVSGTPPLSYTYTFSNVTEDHTIEARFGF